MSIDKKLKSNISSNLLFTLLSMLAPLVVIPTLTQNMGMYSYGSYVTVMSMTALLCVITDFGLGMYLPKEIAANTEKLESISSMASAFVGVKIIFGTLASLFVLILQQESIVLSILISSYVFLLVISPVPILNGFQEYKWLAFSQVVSKLLLICCVLTISFDQMGIEKALGIQVLVNLVLNAFLYYKVNNRCCINLKIKFSDGYLLVRSSFDFYIARLFTNIYQQASTYLVSLFLTSEKVAVYSIALQLYKVGTQLVGAVSSVLYTTVSRYNDVSLIKKVTGLTLLIHVVLLPVVFLYGEVILSYVFDFETLELFRLALCLYTSLFFVIISSFWGYPALTTIGEQKYAHYGIVISASCYFFCFVFFVLFLNPLALYFVLCIIIADAIGAIARLYFAKRFKLL